MDSWNDRVASMLKRFCVAAARYRGRRARGLRRRRRQRRRRPGPGSRSGRARFPDRLHEGPAVRRGRRPPGEHRSARRAALQRRHRSLYARPRVADGRRAQHHVPRDRRHGRRAGRRDLGRRQEDSVRDARPRRRRAGSRRPRSAALGHLGIHDRDRHAAALDHRGHHVRGGPRHLAALPARRPDHLRVDAPTHNRRRSCSTRTSRSSRRSTRTATSPRICCT